MVLPGGHFFMGYSWPGVFLLGASGRTGRFFTQLLFHDPISVSLWFSSLELNVTWIVYYFSMICDVYPLVFSRNKPSAWLEASRTQWLCVCFLVGSNWDLEESTSFHQLFDLLGNEWIWARFNFNELDRRIIIRTSRNKQLKASTWSSTLSKKYTIWNGTRDKSLRHLSWS